MGVVHSPQWAAGRRAAVPSFLGRLPLSSQSSIAKVTLERHMLWQGVPVLRGSLHSLEAVSNIVNFICCLITSMGHCSHPPGNAQQTFFRHSSVPLL